MMVTLAEVPVLPFAEVAEYRSGEIIHLEDSASPSDVVAIGEWMARYGDRLA